jgi:response regulator RpfG family c-di-GMP phosphodiesterase
MMILATPPGAPLPSAASKPIAANSTHRLLQELLASSLLLAEDWDGLSVEGQRQLMRCQTTEDLLSSLAEQGLLTQFQADRVQASKMHGLILGQYRVLNRLGAGGMGVVFRAEHIRLRRVVAVKVLPIYQARSQSRRNLHRFYAEARAVARLQHPNIVAALDAGELANPDDPDAPILHYYVMEYVQGQDLEQSVQNHGPLAPATACTYIYQIASALAEAHKHNLVHRDIKPSNIMITPDSQAKLLDFGLVRQFSHRLTEPGTVLGTVDYIAPEQARDASTVDIRADIYGLGGTLFWCLLGQPPFESQATVAQELARRQTQEPPSVHLWRSEVPVELDAVIARMMACDPNNRYATPQAVMTALVPFLQAEVRSMVLTPTLADGGAPALVRHDAQVTPPRQQRVLAVDDEVGVRHVCKQILQSEGILCDEAVSGAEALAAVASKPYDLILLDWAMPDLTGTDVCRRLRENPPTPHLKIVMFSGHWAPDDLAKILSTGIDDFLTKPFTVTQLVARIKAALRLKEAQDRTDQLTRYLLAMNHQLEHNLYARDSDLVHARKALVLGLAKLVGYRDAETGAHLIRLQQYSRCLAQQAATLPAFTPQIDNRFLTTLECCVPLHDIGKVGLPDHILLKDGRLDPDERIIMQTHTTIGADTLREMAHQHGSSVAFLEMAVDIARHHHERYDGEGYPDRLAGDSIPLAARIVTIGDVYDALRCRRAYKPALAHPAALRMMLETAPGQFDPLLLQAFQRCAQDFERVYQLMPD